MGRGKWNVCFGERWFCFGNCNGKSRSSRFAEGGHILFLFVLVFTASGNGNGNGNGNGKSKSKSKSKDKSRSSRFAEG